MSKDYSEYLAVQVLNEGQTVSYRSLSRALKVHSNLAKQMLYEFHHKQNSKKGGTLHATYLLTGSQTRQQQSSQPNGIHSQGGTDVDMPSSPFPSSSAPQLNGEDVEMDNSLIKLVTLVNEEDLEDAKAQFDQLHSIHIYSLEPGPMKDLHVLTDCNRSIAVAYASEDPLEFWKQYGTIQNSNVKRRTGRRPPPTVTTAAPALKSAKPAPPPKPEPEKKKPAAKETAKDLKRTASTSAKVTPEPEPAPAAKKGTASKPVPVKRESSNLFKSFAKTKAPTKKDAAGSAEASPAPTPAEDELMGGLSDEEAGEEDTATFDEGAIKETTTTGGKSKREREEELRAMMDLEGTSCPNYHQSEPPTDHPLDEPMDDASAAETPQPETVSEADDSQSKAKSAEPEPTETVTVSNGLRRGKRRVMKKKTVKDEEGYLVTREEAAWESFSEDEPAAKKAKVAAPPPAAAKGKKGAAKAGQGSIMSFFSKK